MNIVMITFRSLILPGFLVLLALACNLPAMVTPAETPTSSIPTFEPSPTFPETIAAPTQVRTEVPPKQPPVPSPTSGSAQNLTPLAPQPSPTIQPSNQGKEAILILEPGPGSRISTPLHISGEADSVFEQTLGVRLILDDGTVLALGPVFIESELGQRGPFSVDIPFEVSGERQAVVQVFDSSPRDGGITHLSSVGLILADSGDEQITQGGPHPERVQIYQPEVTSTISGGSAHVEGFALASFEQHLIVEVLDVDGNILGSQPVTVQSEEMGVPGPFSVDVPYKIDSAGPGRIVVRDPSPAFEVDLHVASVEVNLEP